LSAVGLTQIYYSDDDGNFVCPTKTIKINSMAETSYV
jgi:hypothetical protein